MDKGEIVGKEWINGKFGMGKEWCEWGRSG